MPRQRDPDRLTKFSHFLTKLEFIILKIVIFIGFLLWVWNKAAHDFRSNFTPTPTAASATCRSETATLASPQPSESPPEPSGVGRPENADSGRRQPPEAQ